MNKKKLYYVFDLIKKYVYLDEIKTIDADLKTNKKYYTDVKSLYKTIDDKIIKIVDNFNNYYKKLNNDTPTNYDIVKFKTNNDIVSKIDPIAKNLLNLQILILKQKNRFNSNICH